MPSLGEDVLTRLSFRGVGAPRLQWSAGPDWRWNVSGSAGMPTLYGSGARRSLILVKDCARSTDYAVPVPSLSAVYPRSAALPVRSCAVALFDLAKPRLAAMSVLSAMVAYTAAMPGRGVAHALAAAAGITLAAAGALSLNQWWERRTDALMARTRQRPLPRAQISPALALAWSLALSTAGVAALAVWITFAAALVALATIVVYGIVYTPLKRRTRWATEIGAISGALPALLGNAAAGDLAAKPGLVLAALLLLWQMPHFFAIGWKHRVDYRAAGFPLLPAIDPDGRRTAQWSFGYTVALLGVSITPWLSGVTGLMYLFGATFAGAWMLRAAWQFLTAANGAPRDRAARRLFLCSLSYLPIVMGALLADTFLRG